MQKRFKKLARDERREGRQTIRQYGQPDPREKLSFNPARLFTPPKFKALTDGQVELVDAIDENDVIFGIGPAGSGKTRASVALSVESLHAGEIEHIIMARPCILVGGKPKTGFTPGSLRDKVSLYLRPLLDELKDILGHRELERLLEDETIELTSVEYIRGRTIKNAWLIIDEAQNASWDDVRAILSRLGKGSKILMMGDLSRGSNGRLRQCDLPKEEQGAFEYFAERFGKINGIATVTLTVADIVRHPLVKRMIEEGL
jgi:phosphate starvation-inducible PhoH-like protein